MLPIERKNAIYNEFLKNKTLNIKDLAKKFNVSTQTIRRDLKDLEDSGIITTFYGGATLNDKEIPTLNVEFNLRKQFTIKEKEKMALLVRNEFKEMDTIFLDNSSTIYTMSDVVPNINMDIVTNSIQVACKLIKNDNINIFLLGGLIDKINKCTSDNMTITTLNNFNFFKVFISCSSISMKYGLTDSNRQTANIRKNVIDRSKETYLLVDHTKFDKVSLAKISNFDNIDYVVTDKKPSLEWMNFFLNNNIKVLYSE